MRKQKIRTKEEALWIYALTRDLLLMGMPLPPSTILGVLSSALDWADEA